MVSLESDSPDPSEDPQSRRKLAEKLAKGAMIMGGFDPPQENPPAPPVPRFELGKTYATAAITKWAEANGIDLGKFIDRHHAGDWGDLDDDDKAANEDALETGARILSCYRISEKKIYAITEADRGMTTILFASEY